MSPPQARRRLASACAHRPSVTAPPGGWRGASPSRNLHRRARAWHSSPTAGSPSSIATGGGNDTLAQAVARHPGRFIGFAHHNPFGPGPAEEMERAVTQLGLARPQNPGARVGAPHRRSRPVPLVGGRRTTGRAGADPRRHARRRRRHLLERARQPGCPGAGGTLILLVTLIQRRAVVPRSASGGIYRRRAVAGGAIRGQSGGCRRGGAPGARAASSPQQRRGAGCPGPLGVRRATDRPGRSGALGDASARRPDAAVTPDRRRLARSSPAADRGRERRAPAPRSSAIDLACVDGVV